MNKWERPRRRGSHYHLWRDRGTDQEIGFYESLADAEIALSKLPNKEWYTIMNCYEEDSDLDIDDRKVMYASALKGED